MTKGTILSFPIANFQFLDGNVPLAPSYEVYISQFIDFPVVWLKYLQYSSYSSTFGSLIQMSQAFQNFYKIYKNLQVSKFDVVVKTLKLVFVRNNIIKLIASLQLVNIDTFGIASILSFFMFVDNPYKIVRHTVFWHLVLRGLMFQYHGSHPELWAFIRSVLVSSFCMFLYEVNLL